MAFNINSFITAMVNDGARPNLFEIVFSSPPGSIVKASPDIVMKAKATALPSSYVGVAPVYYFGRMAKFAGDRVFENWNVTILLDEQDFRFGAKTFLESWSNQLKRHVANNRDTTMVTPISYMMDAWINLWSKDGTHITASYKMTGCFPTNIGAIPLDWQANDIIMEFPVTFAMQWWERIPATDAGGL